MRKVTTTSGATAVQIVDKTGGEYRVIEHLGSAHTPGEIAALMEVGRERLHPGQGMLDLDRVHGPSDTGSVDLGPSRQMAVLGPKRSSLLIDTIATVYQHLGFDQVGDQVFFDLVLARLVEPTSKLDSLRVLAEIGASVPHYNTLLNAVKRAQDRGYRETITRKCFDYVCAMGDVSLLLYDVTTLYFEAEKEDEFRKVGFSKERRVDPQIVVGLLVDRTGFPLDISCFEGNLAETRTMIPVIQDFQARHQVADMVIAADAGMLSAANLKALDEADLHFVVGSRLTKAPGDLAAHFHWNGTTIEDGQVIETITPEGGSPWIRTESRPGPHQPGQRTRIQMRGGQYGNTATSGPYETGTPSPRSGTRRSRSSTGTRPRRAPGS